MSDRSDIIRPTDENGKTSKKVPDPYDVDPDFAKNPSKLKEPDTQEYFKNGNNAQQTVAKFYIRFRKAESGTAQKRIKWAWLDKLDRGEQWKDGNIPPWVPKPVTNYIRYVRTTKRANLTAGISRPQFTPLHEDDVDTIRMLQLAHDHVWEEERVDRQIRRHIDRALLMGTSIAYIYEDDSFVGGKYYKENDPKNMLFQGKLCLKRWPNQNFFIDPDAYRIDDAKWIDTTEIIALRDVKENPIFIKYCEKMGWLNKLNSLNYTQLEYEDSASGTILERDHTPLNTDKSILGDEIITLHAHWERYFKNGEWHLDVTYWLRNTDFFLLRLEDVQPGCYPFAVYYDEEEENEFWGTSTAMDIEENQKIINKVQQTAAIIGVMHQNPQKVVFRESGINAQDLARTGTLPGKVWQSNVPGEQAITVIKPMDIPKGLYDLDDRTQSNIKDMVGINEAYVGNAPGSVTTSTGVNDLVERATLRDKDKMIQIDQFVEDVSNLIVKFILYKWKDKRPIAITGRNGAPQFGIYEPIKDDLTLKNLHWRVRSDVYAKAPTTQAQRRQQAQQMMQSQGQFQFAPSIVTPEEYIRMLELQDQEEILQRMERERYQMQAAQAQDLAQQITQVAQQLHNVKSQGASDQEASQLALQMAQELLQAQQGQANKNGTTPEGVGANGSQPQSTPQTPRGVTGPVQMANMANG